MPLTGSHRQLALLKAGIFLRPFENKAQKRKLLAAQFGMGADKPAELGLCFLQVFKATVCLHEVLKEGFLSC